MIISNITPAQGWECPRCKRVLSPYTNVCPCWMSAGATDTVQNTPPGNTPDLCRELADLGQSTTVKTGWTTTVANATSSPEPWSTACLTNELAARDGVDDYNVRPYESYDLSIEGPARILVVKD